MLCPALPCCAVLCLDWNPDVLLQETDAIKLLPTKGSIRCISSSSSVSSGSNSISSDHLESHAEFQIVPTSKLSLWL